MVYLDNNATTQIAPDVLDAMNDLHQSHFGNPSSPHSYGRTSQIELKRALQKLASFFEVKETEILFTSGATESLNHLILGFSKRGHIISSQLEHMAALEPLARKESEGFEVTYLTSKNGSISPAEIFSAIKENTVLIVLQAVNPETGIKNSLDEIAHLAAERGIFLIVDGVSWLGKEKVSIPKGVSAIVFSGHKIHGPMGIGFSIIKKGFPCTSLIVGGPQQIGKRGGTENLPGIIGLVRAIELLKDQTIYTEKMENLKRTLEKGILEIYPKAYIHGKNQPRICNTTNICFSEIDGEALLIQLDLAKIAVSMGSACSSGGMQPSRVLLNMGISTHDARSSLRFSLSRYTTEEEINYTLEVLKNLFL